MRYKKYNTVYDENEGSANCMRLRRRSKTVNSETAQEQPTGG